MWKTVVGLYRPQMTVWRMRVACWITDYRHTLKIANTYAFPLRQWFHENASMLCCTYIACLVSVLIPSSVLYSFFFLLFFNIASVPIMCRSICPLQGLPFPLVRFGPNLSPSLAFFGQLYPPWPVLPSRLRYQCGWNAVDIAETGTVSTLEVILCRDGLWNRVTVQAVSRRPDHCEVPGSIPDLCTWDWWWTECHGDRFPSKLVGFLQLYPIIIVSLPSLCLRCTVTST
jgi:hypothetical protein